MVNEDKVRIMTAMAREEKKYGSEITENMQFFKKIISQSCACCIMELYYSIFCCCFSHNIFII